MTSPQPPLPIVPPELCDARINSMVTEEPFDGLCKECGRDFRRVQPAFTHIPCSAKKVEGQYQCLDCEALYPSIGPLGKHRLKVHAKGRFSCNLCPLKTGNRHQMVNHIETKHLGIKKYVCPVIGCSQSFAAAQSRDRHAARKHSLLPSSTPMTTPRKDPDVTLSLLSPISDASDHLSSLLQSTTPAVATVSPSLLDPVSATSIPIADRQSSAVDTSDLQLLLGLMKRCKTCDGYFLDDCGLKEHLKKHKMQEEREVLNAVSNLEESVSRLSTPDIVPVTDARDISATESLVDEVHSPAKTKNVIACATPEVAPDDLMAEQETSNDSPEMQNDGQAEVVDSMSDDVMSDATVSSSKPTGPVSEDQDEQLDQEHTNQSKLTTQMSEEMDTTSAAYSQFPMSPETAKIRCKNFFSTLMGMTTIQPNHVAQKCRKLVQGMIVSLIVTHSYSSILTFLFFALGW